VARLARCGSGGLEASRQCKSGYEQRSPRNPSNCYSYPRGRPGVVHRRGLPVIPSMLAVRAPAVGSQLFVLILAKGDVLHRRFERVVERFEFWGACWSVGH